MPTFPIEYREPKAYTYFLPLIEVVFAGSFEKFGANMPMVSRDAEGLRCVLGIDGHLIEGLT